MFSLFPELKYSTTRYGNPLLLLDGYRYHKYWKTNGPKVTWNCANASRNGCRAAVITIDGVFIKYNNRHNH